MFKLKQYVFGVAFVLLAVLAVTPGTTNAQANVDDEIEEKLALIQSLMQQIADLQLQFAEQQGQIIAELKEGLEEGMTDDQIAEIQELLSTDSDIYPEGLVTGYFGPLTREALKRLQSRHDLEETGEIDEETREYISECFKERRGDSYRQGILGDRNISDRIKERIRSHRENAFANRCRVAEKFGFSCEEGDRSNFIERLKEKIKKEMEEEEENREYEDRAEEVIEEAEQAIEDASDDDAIEEAEESLEDAEEMLEDAKEDFEDEKYRSAFNEAVLTIRTAMVAIKELENVEEDTTEDEAEEVVDSLEDLIAQLEDAINNADDIEAIEAALEILTEAILKLEEAEQDLNDDYYHSAAKVAEEAIELINKILEDLEA